MPGALQHSPADVIRQLIIDSTLGTNPDLTTLLAWPVYRGRDPDRPDNLIKVSDTQGRIFGSIQTDGELQEHHGIQVMVRSVDYSTGYVKARAIAVMLDGVNEELVAMTPGTAFDYIVHGVTRTSDVIALGSDVPQGKRQLFVINATTPIRLCC